ncbi:OstA family protein [Desulfosudis oleivorans Hxd3]|uniref:OstA family protein n=2 Tax=Desulfosudis TaxID=2904716 RepID=A8ZU06_DESOH|nr:OstA family protein [Desulfosudis oleivorans Hxd3]
MPAIETGIWNTMKIQTGLLTICFLVFPALFASADTPPPPQDDAKAIHISADRLVSESRADYAEFTGNVRAVGEKFDIQADTLQVFYSPAPDTQAPGTANRLDTGTGKTVREIIATGNVTILFDDKVAKTDQAVYSRESGRVVLMGPGSTVTGKSGRISGDTITLHTETESVTVISGGETRVQAVIHPDGSKNDDQTEK